MARKRDDGGRNGKPKGKPGKKGKGKGKGGDRDPVPFTMFRFKNEASVPGQADVTLTPTYPPDSPIVSFKVPPSNFLPPGGDMTVPVEGAFDVTGITARVKCLIVGSPNRYVEHDADPCSVIGAYVRGGKLVTHSTSHSALTCDT